MQFGTLYFIPVTLGDDAINRVIPNEAIQLTQRLNHFIVENEKTARRFLKAYDHPKPIRELQFYTLNTNTRDQELPNLLKPLLAGHDVGLMSEAGCPGIADPGAKLASLAHKKGVRVAPLVGPSSILLSLMASGLNGQQFSFLGYLPIDAKDRMGKLKAIEKLSRDTQATQIFIETPYRNEQLFKAIIDTCHANTQLCIASQISLADEYIVTKSITEWKQSPQPDLHKKPTVFLLQG